MAENHTVDVAVEARAAPGQGGGVRFLEAITTEVRKISQIRTPTMAGIQSTPDVPGRNELDSHADTIICGKNWVPLAYTGKTVDVSPYKDTYDSIKDVPIATTGTAYTNPFTNRTFIVVANEAIYLRWILH